MASTTRLLTPRRARNRNGARTKSERMSTNSSTAPIFATCTSPGRGRGLFALINIRQGQRFAAESPIFTLPNIDTVNPTEDTLLQKVESLSPAQQQQFRALYNNHVEDEMPFMGIVRTNALDISKDIDAIYPTFSFLNHSCEPNAHYTWNENIQLGTLHATGDIGAGEEITISYEGYGRGNRDFVCSCQLCTSSPANIARSDSQRARITFLPPQIISRVQTQHEDSLKDLREMRDLLLEVYENRASTSLAWVYFTASQVAASQSDLVIATVFAQCAIDHRTMCEGEDHPNVESYKRVRDDLSLHENYATTRFRETALDDVPEEIGFGELEDWLWDWE